MTPPLTTPRSSLLYPGILDIFSFLCHRTPALTLSNLLPLCPLYGGLWCSLVAAFCSPQIIKSHGVGTVSHSSVSCTLPRSGHSGMGVTQSMHMSDEGSVFICTYCVLAALRRGLLMLARASIVIPAALMCRQARQDLPSAVRGRQDLQASLLPCCPQRSVLHGVKIRAGATPLPCPYGVSAHTQTPARLCLRITGSFENTHAGAHLPQITGESWGWGRHWVFQSPPQVILLQATP